MPDYFAAHTAGNEREVKRRKRGRQHRVVVTLCQESDLVQAAWVFGRILRRTVGQVPDLLVERQESNTVGKRAGQDPTVRRETDLLDVTLAVVGLLEVVRQPCTVVVHASVDR